MQTTGPASVSFAATFFPDATLRVVCLSVCTRRHCPVLAWERGVVINGANSCLSLLVCCYLQSTMSAIADPKLATLPLVAASNDHDAEEAAGLLLHTINLSLTKSHHG